MTRGAKLAAAQAAVKLRRATVDDAHHAQSLEQFVASHFALRRSFARLKIINAEVSIAASSAHGRRLALANGKLKPNAILHAGDVVEVLLPDRTAAPSSTVKPGNKHSVTPVKQTEVQPEINLQNLILYKDQHIIVINKPRAVPVQAGSKMRRSIDEMLDDLKFNNNEAPRLVHRLDKDTTGCLMLARTKDAAIKLSNLFADENANALVKKYTAITCGTPTELSGSITTGIVQHGIAPNEKLSVIEWHETDSLPENRNSVKKAVTNYSVHAKQRHVSLLELVPTTGRKHQLRLHCAQTLGIPILGDYKYGLGCPKQLRSAFGNIKTVPMHLHLKELSIKDWYGEGKSLRVEAPLPDHLIRTIKVFNLGSQVKE
ncbi:pseudouridine synthase [Obelidium mucronatum]|nr:pseudouridine synthase [Obelidium mucronatum]